MYWHCFTATNLLNHRLVWQVRLRLQLVPEKQGELMLLTLPPASSRGRAVKKGGENFFYLSELGTV